MLMFLALALRQRELAVFILEDALFVWLCVSSIKTGTRHIIRLDELFSVVRRSRRAMEDSSSRRIMRLMPVFILETNNQTNNVQMFSQVRPDG